MNREIPHVQLAGENGNIFSIMGRVTQGLRRAGYARERIIIFQEEVMLSTDYDRALQIVMKWLDGAEDEGKLTWA